MQINSINGTSFKGILKCCNAEPFGKRKVAVNTDQVILIEERKHASDGYYYTRLILTNGLEEDIKMPYDKVVDAYEKACSRSFYEIKSEN